MARPTRKQQFLNALKTAGGRCSNPTLSAELGWDDDIYWRIHTELWEEGKIEKGRGYGGTAILTDIDAQAEPNELEAPRMFQNERELYEPAVRQIQLNWQKGHRLDACHVENVAHQGARETGGNWSRPDIALVALKTFEYLPNRIMEIHTFEVKPHYDVTVKGVMESLTHRQFATRSYVIYYTAGKKLSDFPESSRIEAIASKHGIGVISAKDIEDYNSWEFICLAERTTPDPEEVELFIKRSLGDGTKTQILKWLK
ncbi:MAG: hypothetical protein R3E18_10445 [Sphingomonadaceae bacterium]|nr:hypothetical protein [Sphingomonadaceae bacterium]